MGNTTYIVSKSSVSKSSIIGDHVGARSKGQFLTTRVIYREQKSDLVLLALDKKINGGLKIREVANDTLTFSDLGEVLIAPHPGNGGHTSVIGSLQFTLPPLYSGAYLGASLKVGEGKCIINGTAPKSPANLADLKSGDEIFAVNGVEIRSTEQFIREIQKNSPYDIVKLIYFRAGQKDTAAIKLATRPLITSEHVAEKFPGGKSIRYDGFKNAFINDFKLLPVECGGPIFNLEGKFIGINMARYSRTSSIAISVAEVNRFIHEALVLLAQKSLTIDGA